MNYSLNSENKEDLLGVMNLLVWHGFGFSYSPTKGVSYIDLDGRILRDIQNTMKASSLVVTISRI